MSEAEAAKRRLYHICALAHFGGLEEVDEWRALNAIRSLTLPYFNAAQTTEEATEAVRAALAEAKV